MKELQLIFKILESSPNRVKTLSLLNGRKVVPINSKILKKNEPRSPIVAVAVVVFKSDIAFVVELLVGVGGGFEGFD